MGPVSRRSELLARDRRRWLWLSLAPVPLLLLLAVVVAHAALGDSAGPVDVASGGGTGVDLGPSAATPPAPRAPLHPDGAALQAAALTTLLPGRPTPRVATYRVEPAEGEFRGSWLHCEDYCNPVVIARTLAKARQAGLNVLLPMANYPDQAMWRGHLLPVNPSVPAGFDPLRALAVEAHKVGIQIHPYMVMLNGGLTKHPVIQSDWYVVDAHGQRVGGWLNPAHPGVRDFLAQMVAEVAATGVDGVSYDYIRHEYDTDYDYSEFTRRKFMAEEGFDPLTLRQPAPEGGEGMRLLRTRFHAGEGAGLLRQERDFVAEAGYRPQTVEADNLGMLSRRTVLVAGNLYGDKVPRSQLAGVLRFVREGGAAVVLDGPVAGNNNAEVAEAMGLAGQSFFEDADVTVTLSPNAHPILQGVPATLRLHTRGNPCTQVAGAEVLASFADGRPAVAWRRYGSGTVVVLNFHCYQGTAATDAGVLRLFSNAVEWLAAQHSIVNTAKTGLRAGSPAAWDRWRVEQVTELVKQCTAAARSVRPDILVSAAGGTRATDLEEVRRDGRTWLARGYVNFLLPMAYTTNADTFRNRLSAEMAPVEDRRLRRFIYSGIGAYKLEDDSQKVIDQVAIARDYGLRGICLFAFENLTDAMVSKLGHGPFRQPTTPPWRVVAN